MSTKKGALLLILYLLNCSCATSGNPTVADLALTSKIGVGSSTKQDVLNALGKPNFVHQSELMEIWSYAYTNLETSPVTFVPIVGLFAGSSKVETSSFTVSFDREGVVRSVSQGNTRAVGGQGTR